MFQAHLGPHLELVSCETLSPISRMASETTGVLLAIGVSLLLAPFRAQS